MPPSQTNVYSDCFVDYLTCGGCALEFPLQNITNFIQHKKVGCLDPPDVEPAPISDGPDENALLCYTCSRDFMTARGLLQHIQLSHNLKVFLQPGEEQLQVSQREKKQAKKMPVNLKTGSVVPSVKQASVSEDSLAAEKKKSSNDDDIAQNHAVEIMSGRHQSDKQCQNNDYEQEMTSNSRTTICCNSQECCVTIIPGTHERPKKCCSAVIPKKRKQHMAEHMGNSGDQESSGHEMSDRESDQNDDNETQEDSNSNSIFIDFHPQFRSFNQNSSNRNTTQNTDRNDSHKNSDLPIATKTESFEMSGTQEMVEPSTTVIHAGKSYNIPVSYTYSLTDFRIINNKSVKIFPSMSDKQQQPNCIGPQTSSIESQMNFEVPVTSLQNKSVELECQTLPTVSLLGTGIATETTSLYEASRETELDDSDKDYEMEIDETLQDRGRKRRYPTSRPFKCSQCDRAFNQRIHLRKHMSKHTGVKPFKCAQCSYATVERSHLKVHIRIHTGEKPFKCTFCKYATAQNSTLKIHLKRHHNGKMLECEDCHKQFTQHEMLTSHRMGHQQSKQPVMTVGTSQDRINRTATSRHWPNIVSENNT